jgi:hypothetical protein
MCQRRHATGSALDSEPKTTAKMPILSFRWLKTACLGGNAIYAPFAAVTLADIWPNDGIHFHAILMYPKKPRLKGKLSRHIKQNRACYLGQHGKLAKIHVRRVKQLQGRMVNYLFKHIKRRTFSLDDVLILPRSIGELP